MDECFDFFFLFFGWYFDDGGFGYSRVFGECVFYFGVVNVFVVRDDYVF